MNKLIIKKNNNILNNLKSSLSKKVSFNPYLKLFILGDKKDIDESYNYYKDIGVAHLLAISGMHVGVFVSVAYGFTKTNTVNDRSVVQFIRDDGIFLTE